MSYPPESFCRTCGIAKDLVEVNRLGQIITHDVTNKDVLEVYFKCSSCQVTELVYKVEDLVRDV